MDWIWISHYAENALDFQNLEIQSMDRGFGFPDFANPKQFGIMGNPKHCFGFPKHVLTRNINGFEENLTINRKSYNEYEIQCGFSENIENHWKPTERQWESIEIRW